MPILCEYLDSIDYVMTAVTFTQKYQNKNIFFVYHTVVHLVKGIKPAATTITIMSINIQS